MIAEATKIIVKEVFPFSTILSSKVRNFLSNRFHLTVNHLGTILKDRVSPENLLTQPQGRPIREIVDNNFIIKLIALTGTSLFNIKEKLLFFNKETTSVKENVPIVRNRFTLGVFFMWFISQILSPEQLASLSLEELLYLQEIYESNGEKDSRLLSDYDESVEIVAYHNILQEFLKLGNKIVDFQKKHPLFWGIFMTSLMSLLIIRERPQLMEQMFHKMHNTVTHWTNDLVQHLKSELYDKKEELKRANKAVEDWKAKYDNRLNNRIRKFDKNEQKLENRIADITNQIDQLWKLKKHLKICKDSLRKTRNEIFDFKKLLMEISTFCPETFTIIQTYLDKLPSLNDDLSLDKNIFEKGIEKFRNIFKKKKE